MKLPDVTRNPQVSPKFLSIQILIHEQSKHLQALFVCWPWMVNSWRVDPVISSESCQGTHRKNAEKNIKILETKIRSLFEKLCFGCILYTPHSYKKSHRICFNHQRFSNPSNHHGPLFLLASWQPFACHWHPTKGSILRYTPPKSNGWNSKIDGLGRCFSFSKGPCLGSMLVLRSVHQEKVCKTWHLDSRYVPSGEWPFHLLSMKRTSLPRLGKII